MNPASGNFLVLYPRNPHWAPNNPDSISQALHAVGLTGEEREPFLFSTGPEYLGLVTYLGCSPQIDLGKNEASTIIRLNGVFDSPQCLAGENLKSPRCPQCSNPVDMPAAEVGSEKELCCKHCGHCGQSHEFNWRRSAAFGRIFIEISNVFESEAVPGEGLTDCLLKATGEVWEYSYIRRA